MKIFCKNHIEATCGIKLAGFFESLVTAEWQEQTCLFSKGSEVFLGGFTDRKKNILKAFFGNRGGKIRMTKGKKPLAARGGEKLRHI